VFRSSPVVKSHLALAAAEGERGGCLTRASPGLLETECRAVEAPTRPVDESLPDGGRALVVGHSPTDEAAILGLVGEIVEPISKGDGVLVVEEDGALRVEKLD
jgi:hypothetical protein